MPNYGYDFGTLGVGGFSRGMQPGLDVWRRKRIQEDEDATKSAIEAGRLQLEAAKSGAWEGYQPEPEPGQGISPDTSINYPDAMTAQGREAAAMGGQSRVQSLQGISNAARRKAESDEASAQVKRLTDLTTQAKTQMDVLISSDNYTNKSMDELIAKKNRYEKTGNSYPSDVLDFEIKQINRVRELAKLEPITVKDLNNVNEFKTKIGVRDSEFVVKNYNELLKPDTTPERKAELIGELSSQVPEIRKRNADPKMFMEIDEALKQQTAELAKMTTEKQPTPPMYEAKPISETTQQKFRFNPKTGENDIPYGKPYPIYKPEDITGDTKKRWKAKLASYEESIGRKATDKEKANLFMGRGTAADAFTETFGPPQSPPEAPKQIAKDTKKTTTDAPSLYKDLIKNGYTPEEATEYIKKAKALGKL